MVINEKRRDSTTASATADDRDSSGCGAPASLVAFRMADVSYSLAAMNAGVSRKVSENCRHNSVTLEE
ncbi:UNVERIFIED_CONTAM: hypothetical protein K2H54_048527 [Gekko kuhli]